jgi:hypothetical protein
MLTPSPLAQDSFAEDNHPQCPQDAKEPALVESPDGCHRGWRQLYALTFQLFISNLSSPLHTEISPVNDLRERMMDLPGSRCNQHRAPAGKNS